MSTTNHRADAIGTDSCIDTETARRKLDFKLHHALANQKNTIIHAPTSLGKSHTVASTRWRDRPEYTGREPVVHLHHSKDARDEAAEMSEAAGVEYAVLKSGRDICPVATGRYDGEIPTVRGKTASEWLKRKVELEDYAFHEAHKELERRHGKLPCDRGDSRCPSRCQWEDVPRDEDEMPAYDVIHATHSFAHVGKLTEGANIIFDEQPSFETEVGSGLGESLYRSINRILAESETEKSSVGLRQAVLDQQMDQLNEYRRVLAQEHSVNIQSSHQYVHSYAQRVGVAIAHAKPTESGNRFAGEAGGIKIVIDRQGTLRRIHSSPCLADARCVIGLDAYPCLHLWKLNTVEDLTITRVLSQSAQKRWRRERRGLTIKQVGNHTRSYTGGWRGQAAKGELRAIMEHLQGHYGSRFRTAISSKATVNEVKQMLVDIGAENPRTMHHGNLKSRNDFTDEEIGLVVGCIDPGDDRILDWLALRGLDAVPEQDDDGERDYGRGFVGPDADAAAELLASVRENNLAQAAGRYARNPDSSAPGATVYVWSDALPESLTDEIVPGVISRVTDAKEAVAQYVHREGTVTKKQTAEQCDICEQYAYRVLQELSDQGVVSVSKRSGRNGADEYVYVSGTVQQSVDLGF